MRQRLRHAGAAAVVAVTAVTGCGAPRIAEVSSIKLAWSFHSPANLPRTATTRSRALNWLSSYSMEPNRTLGFRSSRQVVGPAEWSLAGADCC